MHPQINIYNWNRSYMHHNGPLPLTFEGLEQGFEGKNCQNASQGKTLPCMRPPKKQYLWIAFN